MFRKVFFCIGIAATLASCTRETEFHEVKVNDRYALLIPDYLQPCTDISKVASLQYQNEEKGVYAIVIDEKKSTMQDYNLDYDLDFYFNSIASQGFLESIKDGKVSIPGRETINGNKALIADVTGKIENNEVYYRLAVIESPYEFYQILIWTHAKNKDKYFPDMSKMIESFRELPHPKEELPVPKLNDSVSITPAW